MVEAFPWDTAPSYLIRDSDGAYGQAFTNPLLIVYLETVDSAISKPSFSSSPCVVQPDTILRWHRDRLFRTSPWTMRRARPSAIAVLPTPASPTKSGLFFCRRHSTWMVRLISASRPISGSILPSRAFLLRLMQ